MINGVAYDHENIRIDVGGTELSQVVSIDYGASVETEKQFGSGREAFDATDGVGNVDDVEMVLPEFEYRNLIERLGPGYLTKAARFGVSVTYSHEGEATFSDTLERCRIITDAHSSSQGPDGLEVTITLQVMRILKGTSTGQIDPFVAS